MAKRKVLCVCSAINKFCILYGQNLQGEIFFKHSPKCKSKVQGTYEWIGAGFERREE
jgi:hypothetical protein